MGYTYITSVLNPTHPVKTSSIYSYNRSKPAEEKGSGSASGVAHSTLPTGHMVYVIKVCFNLVTICRGCQVDTFVNAYNR